MAPDRSRDLRDLALAAGAYLLIVLWTFRAVLPAFATSLPQLARALGPAGQLGRWDQSMVLSVVTDHAHALLTHPTRLLADGQCYPMPHAYTLGEHMLGTSLLALVPYAITHDPIATFNVVLILSLWIPAIAMYLLSREFVRDAGAAFVAGLLFALEPVRLIDFGHPFVHGDLWTPLALLFLHRTVTRRRWRDAALLTLFAVLALLQSLYALIASAILLGCLGVFLAWHAPRACRRALPLLCASIAVVLAVAWALFVPYIETRATWSVLAGRAGVPAPGTLGVAQAAVVLALIGLADRLRGPRVVGAGDPRLALAAGGVLIYWCALAVVVVPALGVRLPSPLLVLRGVVPGLDAVRATGAIGPATGLVTSFLAGYAVLALAELVRRPLPRALLIAALALYVVAERSAPPLARRVFGSDFVVGAWQARPDDADLRLLRASAGPILRLPIARTGTLKGMAKANHLRLVSFDPRPTSDCYNSFGSPLAAQLQRLAAALPDPAAADALYALGFRTVLVALGEYWPRDLRRFERALHALAAGPVRLVPIGRTARLASYRLVARGPYVGDLRALRAAPDERAPATALAAAPATLAFTFVNHQRVTFRQPDPIAPRDVLVRFRGDGGRVREQRRRLLLPLALAPGAAMTLPVEVEVPPTAGHYVAELALAAAPATVLAGLDVAVSAPREDGVVASSGPS